MSVTTASVDATGPDIGAASGGVTIGCSTRADVVAAVAMGGRAAGRSRAMGRSTGADETGAAAGASDDIRIVG